MAKEFKVIGYNPMLVDALGNRFPVNAKVYKTEAEIGKDIEKGEIVVHDGFVGLEILEIKSWVEVKAKSEPKAKEEPKAKAPATTDAANA
jgi:hypothetical protein